VNRGESLRATEAAMREWTEDMHGEPTDATVSRRVDVILRAIGVKARRR
jgi:hypothetical protein